MVESNIAGGVSSITVGAASAQLVGANNKRHSLTVFANPTNRITITDATTAVLDQGINIPAGGTWFVITKDLHGDLVTKRLFAIAAAGGTTVGIIEATGTGD
jgi:hypothetical protein